MDKETMRTLLEDLMEQEQTYLTDNYSFIRDYVDKYSSKYGADEWLNEFRSQYIDMRCQIHEEQCRKAEKHLKGYKQSLNKLFGSD